MRTMQIQAHEITDEIELIAEAGGREDLSELFWALVEDGQGDLAISIYRTAGAGDDLDRRALRGLAHLRRRQEQYEQLWQQRYAAPMTLDEALRGMGA